MKYNNAYHKTIKSKLVNVKDRTFINHSAESNDKGPKLEVGDHVRISKYRNIFAKRCTPNWFLLFKKLKILYCRHMLLVILKVKKLLECFTKKN